MQFEIYFTCKTQVKGNLGVMSTSFEPRLDMPGAGLPGPELLIARRLFGLRCRFGNRDKFVAKFVRERDLLRNLIEQVPEERRSERVLIRRLRGLEDSSRHWSLWMTLDHLRIVNLAIGEAMVELVAGRMPAGRVSTADVKPDPGASAEVEALHEEACDRFLGIVEKHSELKTGAKYDHPWFGPLDAFGWLALASMHMGIHRAQAEAIIDGFNG